MNPELENILKRREIENEQHRESLYVSLDRLIFAVTSGTLVLSITTLGTVGVPKSVAQLIFLLAAWGSLLVGLIANLLSFWTAIADTHRKRRYFISAIVDPSKAQVETLTHGDRIMHRLKEPKGWVPVTTLCNVLATLGLLAGILLLTIYVGNVQWEQLKDKSRQEQTAHTIGQQPH